MVGTTGIEQVAGFVGSLAAVFPSVTDKFDADEAVDQYADSVGIAPNIIRSDEVVAQVRDQKAKAQAAQAQAQMAMQTAQGAKVLSETRMQQNSALDALLGSAGIGQ
jgi:hypothetical protein